jgi:hypothetical protein
MEKEEFMMKYIVLGVAVIALSGCSVFSPKPRQIEISAKPIDKPQLILPDATKLNLNEVEWIVITKDNAEEVFAELEKSRKDAALVGLTDEGYKVLSMNYSDIMAYIQQQNAIIAAYKNYYEESEQALEDANSQIDKANEEVKTQSEVKSEDTPFWKRW